MDKEQMICWNGIEDEEIKSLLENITKIDWNEAPNWDKGDYEIEPDSSLAAWKHYNKYYKVNWEDYSSYATEIENKTDNRVRFLENNLIYKNVNGSCNKQGEWFNYSDFETWANWAKKKEEYKNYHRRLVAGKQSELENRIKYNDHEYFKAVDRIGGDCDFNFNEDKKNKFNNLIKDDELKEQLYFCSVMHHNFLNFSVMQVMGKLQGFKSKSYDENLYEHLHDRCDTLIYWLNLFYTNDTSTYNKAMNKFYGKNTSPENKKVLENYLNSFDDIYNYCNQIYFIYDDVFIDKLIKNGKKPIKVAADVNRYMDLAMGFWGRKLIAFKKIDDFIEKDELDCEKEKLFEEIRKIQNKHGDEIGNLIFEKW